MEWPKCTSGNVNRPLKVSFDTIQNSENCKLRKLCLWCRLRRSRRVNLPWRSLLSRYFDHWTGAKGKSFWKFDNLNRIKLSTFHEFGCLVQVIKISSYHFSEKIFDLGSTYQLLKKYIWTKLKISNLQRIIFDLGSLDQKFDNLNQEWKLDNLIQLMPTPGGE